MARILLAEDDEDIRVTFQEALQEALGCEVRTVASGTEARDLLEHEAYDIVIADERMPGMLGSTLLAWLGDHRPRTVRVLVTAHMTPPPERGGVADLVFHKPFHLAAVTQALREALARRPLPPAV
jgi:DNA-binding NtrC family response regulator